MNNGKSKNIIIILLSIIIIILAILCILFATDIIIINNNEEEVSNIENNVIESEESVIEINYEEIAKEKMPTIISLANQERGFYTYCGEISTENDNIIKENLTFNVSTKFSNLTNLKTYLNERISEELVNKYFSDEKNYIEQDNKLYCQVDAKGTEFVVLRNESNVNSFGTGSEYTISNQTENTFEVVFKANYVALGAEEANNVLTAKATFTKINDNWIITKYEDSVGKIN